MSTNFVKTYRAQIVFIQLSHIPKMKNLETESSNSIIGGLADEVTVVNGRSEPCFFKAAAKRMDLLSM
ncbi:unnamed protein product [Arabidopsis lyrata]|uniref:Predicted protein n=1 Tax=Arabidopsis lyrata subsp. lyrata TaxID=81972 RepID=D7KUR3_ARALL|nr:predicted protein [Arabidopsis lyrata subsp. lyrata]CAH8256127.1 unnamed protein product [Arabidopsis lyrata]